MKMIRNVWILIFAVSCVSAFAHINPKKLGEKPTNNNNINDLEVNFREDCQAPEEQADLNINNVRARLLTGGDLWWDLDEGRYIVPNVPIGSGIPEVSSLFAGGVWLGGLDPSDNLKLAASEYRGNGQQDYYTGPLDPTTGLTDAPICEDWDEFFFVNGDEIKTAIRLYDQSVISGDPFECDSLGSGMFDWPGKGNPFFPGDRYDFELPDTEQALASFWDEDGDGNYDPCTGDFPIIDIRGCEPENRDAAEELIPDQMVFWIYNDAGGPHSLTQGAALNMEVQVQAFAYATNDEINDMTFYRYKLINRGLTDLRNTYFAMWVDPDLGCFEDDYVGCDVERSLAYTYNEDLLDGSTGCDCNSGVNTYCDEVPIIGTDYFRGPLSPQVIVGEGEGTLHIIKKADIFNTALYAEGDSIYIRGIRAGEQVNPDIQIELGMSSFIYYNNGGIGTPDPQTIDPQVAQQYYNYLEGLWLDRTPITFGEDGFNPGSTDTIRYAFPGNPDDLNDWSMCTANLPFGDRRTIQASGPFLLKPGSVNELIVGAVWVPDLDYPCPDISRLQNADDLAQALFDACFDIIDGPDAPDMCAVELDREVILVLSNDTLISNNAFELYQERDILAPEDIEDEDAAYEFEGYRIYQLVDQTVSPQELSDIDKARIVADVDVRNGIAEIYNWSSIIDPNPASNELIWIPELQVEALDEGIRNTFRVTDDLFAAGDTRLLNHTQYFYMVIAYAHNNYETFDPRTGLGQRTPYLEGRNNIKTLTVIPRPIVYTDQKAQYGDGPVVTRLDGVGLGSNFVDLDSTMYDAILNGNTNGEVVYKEGEGPIQVSIYNPLEVKDGTFVLEVNGQHQGGALCRLQPGATWTLTNEGTGEVIQSIGSIDNLNEQLLAEYGFSVSIGQSEEPGSGRADNNGALGIELEYLSDDAIQWYGALRDDGRGFAPEEVPGFLNPFFNFLRTADGEPDFNRDPNQDFSTAGDGLFYPFVLTSGNMVTNQDVNQPYITPAWKVDSRQGFLTQGNGLDNLNNVDIVFTQDKSKWSRCVVVETANEDYQATRQTEGGADMFALRAGQSIDQDGNPDGDGTGMSWFPGYAVDVETGKRLNIFFGENSVFDEDFALDQLDNGIALGRDMEFNPSSQLFSTAGQLGQGGQGMEDLVMGGNHFIYVTRQEYDGCESLRNELSQPLSSNFSNIINALKSITWSSITLLRAGTQFLPYADGAVPSDLIVKLRVDNPYNLEKAFNLSSPSACVTVGGNPRYRFEIRNKEAVEVTTEDFASALASANVVPNPYYGISSYETTQFTTTVKITNLPARCDVTIYSLDGKFIRQFRRDERSFLKPGSNPGVVRTQELPDIEWDLTNYAGIPIASGAYLIHIAAPEFGEERTLKWFGVNRQFDPSGL